MPTVLILGSCVSRDAIEFDKSFKVTRHFSRSSWAALTSPPIKSKIELDFLDSPFQKRVVGYEVERVFLNYLSSDQSDLILIDLIEERYPLFEFEPGAYLTVSDELMKTGVVTEWDDSSDRCVLSGSDKHRELWLRGAEKIFTEFQRLSLLDKVRVSKIFWATQFEDDTSLPERFNVATIKRKNDYLAWMYDQIAKYIKPEQFIEYQEGSLKAAKNHKWGVAPFHYTESLYKETLKALSASRG